MNLFVSKILPTLALCLFVLPVWAGSFQVAPIRVELAGPTSTMVLTVRNESATDDVVIQTRPMIWQQSGGKDEYTATTDLIANPPIFSLKPGGQQIVRVGLRKPGNLDIEQTYRLYLTEVAPPPRPGFQGLQVVLNLGVPVFIAPKAAVNRTMNWKSTLRPDGKLELTLQNNGNVHTQILELHVTDKNKPEASIATYTEPRYVLAGQHYRWTLPVTRKPANELQLKVKTYTSNHEYDLSLLTVTP